MLKSMKSLFVGGMLAMTALLSGCVTNAVRGPTPVPAANLTGAGFVLDSVTVAPNVEIPDGGLSYPKRVYTTMLQDQLRQALHNGHLDQGNTIYHVNVSMTKMDFRGGGLMTKFNHLSTIVRIYDGLGRTVLQVPMSTMAGGTHLDLTYESKYAHRFQIPGHAEAIANLLDGLKRTGHVVRVNPTAIAQTKHYGLQIPMPDSVTARYAAMAQ